MDTTARRIERTLQLGDLDLLTAWLLALRRSGRPWQELEAPLLELVERRGLPPERWLPALLAVIGPGEAAPARTARAEDGRLVMSEGDLTVRLTPDVPAAFALLSAPSDPAGAELVTALGRALVAQGTAGSLEARGVRVSVTPEVDPPTGACLLRLGYELLDGIEVIERLRQQALLPDLALAATELEGALERVRWLQREAWPSQAELVAALRALGLGTRKIVPARARLSLSLEWVPVALARVDFRRLRGEWVGRACWTREASRELEGGPGWPAWPRLGDEAPWTGRCLDLVAALEAAHEAVLLADARAYDD